MRRVRVAVAVRGRGISPGESVHSVLDGETVNPSLEVQDLD